MFRKIISLAVTFGLFFQQVSFAQIATELNLSGYLARMHSGMNIDKFRPEHLRYFNYDLATHDFKVLLDRGDLKNTQAKKLKNSTQTLLNYFLVGVALHNESFWVNLRPDTEDEIIDPYLAQTDVGKIMLEADLQLKKDTARLTSPETPEGREYWNRLYKKAEELFGYDNVNIPTLTRPWIVPGEIIIHETDSSAYIYKATLRVMLEQDYLKSTEYRAQSLVEYSFKDPRLKALNDYSTQLIRELIIPKLTKEVNSSKRYANIRQVYYSLILSRWFKDKFQGQSGGYASRINRLDLSGLTSQEPWSKTTYFKEYQKSFQEGEYNIQEPVYTPTGQVIRSYFSGGMALQNINTGNGFMAGVRGVSQILPKTKTGELMVGNADNTELTSSPRVAAGSPIAEFELVKSLKEHDLSSSFARKLIKRLEMKDGWELETIKHVVYKHFEIGRVRFSSFDVSKISPLGVSETGYYTRTPSYEINFYGTKAEALKISIQGTTKSVRPIFTETEERPMQIFSDGLYKEKDNISISFEMTTFEALNSNNDAGKAIMDVLKESAAGSPIVRVIDSLSVKEIKSILQEHPTWKLPEIKGTGTFELFFDEEEGSFKLMHERNRETTSDHSEFYKGIDTFTLTFDQKQTKVEYKIYDSYHTKPDKETVRVASLPGQNIVSISTQGKGSSHSDSMITLITVKPEFFQELEKNGIPSIDATGLMLGRINIDYTSIIREIKFVAAGPLGDESKITAGSPLTEKEKIVDEAITLADWVVTQGGGFSTYLRREKGFVNLLQYEATLTLSDTNEGIGVTVEYKSTWKKLEYPSQTHRFFSLGKAISTKQGKDWSKTFPSLTLQKEIEQALLEAAGVVVSFQKLIGGKLSLEKLEGEEVIYCWVYKTFPHLSHLQIRTQEELDRTRKYASQQDREIFKRLTSDAFFSLERDKEGRVVIPTILIEKANLGEEVVVIKQANYYEIWSKKNWEKNTSAAGSPIQNRISAKLEEIKKNSGLPISKTLPTYPVGGSDNEIWSEALGVLYFDADVYRRVESPDKEEKRDVAGNIIQKEEKGEITTGEVEDSNKWSRFRINELKRQYDVRTEIYKSIRLGSGVRDYIENENAQVTPEAYFMHRGVFASKEDILKAFYGDNKLRFDITILPPATWGREYAKTIGHYHYAVDFPEIYQVVSGEVLWLMQECDIGNARTEEEIKEALKRGKIKEFIVVKAKAGDIVIMLPRYGHVSVNISETEPLVMANWLTWHQKSYYGSFKEKRGAAYYVIKNDQGQLQLIPNPKYLEGGNVLPPPQYWAAKDQIPAFGLKRGEPIYNLVKLKNEEFLKKTRFLYHPNDPQYRDLLTPDATLDEAKPGDIITVSASSALSITSASSAIEHTDADDIIRMLNLKKGPYDEQEAITELVEEYGYSPEDAERAIVAATEDSKASSVVQAVDRPGGIDFRSLPMTIKPMGSFEGLNFKLPQLSSSALMSFNISEEIQQLSQMASRGIMPSGARVEELVAAAWQKGQLENYQVEILTLLAEICKLQEGECCEASEELKVALVVANAV